MIAVMIMFCCAFEIEAFAEFKLDENGVLWGKGNNEYGQLGREPQFEINKYGDKEYIKIEEFVPVLDNVKSYCGVFTLYAIREDNSLWNIGRPDGKIEEIIIPITVFVNGENMLYKNGEAIELDAVAEITNDCTMVPVRAISEAFGCTVKWNNETKTVEIIA